MNSSGIKRGLAATAVGALAVTGVPALATSASAEVGDVLQVVSTTNARNAGQVGALVVLNTSGVNENNLELAATNLDPNEDSGTQSVEIVDAVRILSGAPGDATPNNNLDQINVRVTVTTPNAGDTAEFVIFEDEGEDTDNDPATPAVFDGQVDAAEARAQASVQTAGPVANLTVTPSSQSAPAGQTSAPYTVTLRDAGGRQTQLGSSEFIDLAIANGTVSDLEGDNNDTIGDLEAIDGDARFVATSSTVGSQRITVSTDDSPSNASTTATLVVQSAATLDLADLDVVTGADSADGAPTDPTFVRVDQTSVRLNIDSDDAADANSVVTFTVAGNGLTFGGQTSTTVTTTLDGNGVGSVVITPDAGTIQAGDSFDVTGNGINALTFEFQRAEISAASVNAPDVVYTQVDTPTSVTVTVVDQFGNPVEGAQVSARSAGTGVTDTRPRQTTNANGQVTFTFPAGDTQAGDQDTITYTVYRDAATPDANGITASETTEVNYTVDGLGPDYQLTLDGENTEGATYTADDVTIEPLTDGVANNNSADQGDEVVELTIVGGDNGQPVEVTVDNGAIILTGGDVNLEDGESSVTGTVGQTLRIAGTQSGLVTVTTTAGGRTETAQFTVEAQDDATTARNVGVSGPATVEAGASQVPFIAVVTDAFGNPVPGVPVSSLNVQVSGPGQLQDSGAVTDAQGQIPLNVRLDDDAEGALTVTVTGIPGATNQFGDEATDEGLPASANVATATTTVEGTDEPEEPTDPVQEPINPGIKLKNVNRSQPGMDWVKIGARKAAGAKVRLFEVLDNGNRKLVARGNISDKGQKIFIRPDRNRRAEKTFVAVVAETDRNRRGVTRQASIN
ncbi:hypothetical protein [Nocardioides sp. SYSU DS0663]|uniref:hypothetical protein n=1 Tax=Nocardioides sp. SYSU DS0663 TaxID=3416445 RepID=UPI003F4C9094